ncbi:DUF255 domain-containing protein [Tengunoibacter tsumagoiensis]|uniref:Spermatogenesis-associated protein 20-like TRX domain-containing protein n=1 Tax=Tengunoibacter tsumagoiensis TaxID=2014871 RepID=A0A401ZYZ6_9CHLR|nr:DUF255 domain-containing protein [Tengunoibacter tsumagoiensis]GCE12053.1 hypothetical protein KTT_19120 [Tengunoibacter tsumagoiensis]
MGGSSIVRHALTSAPMPEVFRFSPQPHQADRIQWRGWGQAAFAEAMQTRKPVFLVITSLWCQWCHNFDETTLSHPGVISMVNEHYIPIRVDSDLRPDINQRYNQNGWPSVALLSPDGEVLWGGVSVPTTRLLYYFSYIRRYYSDHQQELAEQVQMLQVQRNAPAEFGIACPIFFQPQARQLLETVPSEAAKVLYDLYDAENGGFRIHSNLKFSHPDALELLLILSRQNQPEALDMVRYSLAQMRDGGLWDNEEGAFFRYSAASDWSMPHTEKMLEENAALLRVVAGLAQQTKEGEWFDLTRQLVLSLNTLFWQAEKGVFSGSQSADEAYYGPGPYSRATRQRPLVDTTVYTSWNAQMISAYLLASHVLGYSSLRTIALQALDYLCSHLIHPGGSVYHYELEGQGGLPGQLADQVWLTRALLDAYEVSNQKQYLETAIALMHFVCRELFDSTNSLFYDSPVQADAIGRMAQREQPLGENALAAECLLRMAVYSRRPSMRVTGLHVLAGCLEQYHRTGIQGALYACVVAQALEKQWL